MRLTVVTLSGRELAAFEADATWGKREICAHVLRLEGSLLRSARLVYQSRILSDQDTLAGIGVMEAATITIIVDVHHAFVLLTSSDDHTAKVWSVETGEELLTLVGHGDSVTCVAMSSDGGLLVTAAANGVAKAWNGGTGECFLTVRAADEFSGIDSVAVSECRAHFATASMASGVATLWGLEGNDPLGVWLHEDVRRVAFSPTSRFAMTVAFDGSQKMWDVATGHCLRTLERNCMTLDAAFSLNGETMLLAPFADAVELTRMRTGECLLELDHGGETAIAVAMTPSGDAALTVTSDGAVSVWSTETGECNFKVDSDASIRTVCFVTSGGARMFATGSDSGNVKIWDLATGRFLRLVEAHTDAVRSMVGVASAAVGL
jgi:hypothetical protein